MRKGQVLFQIDARPFEATLAQAHAQLGEAQAQLGKTERDLARDRPLAEQRAIPQSQLDNDVQANLAAQAAVKSVSAAVETAQLNAEFTRVVSLIDGVAAIATAQIGDLVGTDHAAHDGVADRSDEGVLPLERAGISPNRRSHQ